MGKLKGWKSWSTGLAVLCCSAAAWSQQSAGRGQAGPWVWGISGAVAHQFEADIDDSAGDFNVSRYSLGASVGYARDRRTSISLSLGLGESRYDFSRGAQLAGSTPWDDIRDYRISLPLRFSPAERADVILVPGVRSAIEDGASLDDGRTEGLLAAMGWRFSDTLTLGPGLGWFSELGGGSTAFPIILLDWKITDEIALTTVRGMATAQGPGLSLVYQLRDKWQLAATASYQKNRFALDDDGPARGGYGQDKGLPLLLSLDYTPWPRTSLSALLGAKVAGELRREDSRGRVLDRSDFDTAPMIGISFSSRF